MLQSEVRAGLRLASRPVRGVAAKNVMASVPDYLLIETAFTCVQWIPVGLMTAVSTVMWRRGAPAPPALTEQAHDPAKEVPGEASCPARHVTTQNRRVAPSLVRAGMHDV
jgi:hypothetical protein